MQVVRGYLDRMNAQLPASVRFDIHGLAQSMRLSSALDAVPLNLTDAQWPQLANYLQPVALQQGQVLIEQGVKDRTVYFVESGTLTVHYEDSRERVRIAVVARSEVREKDPVTTLDPVWDVGTATTVSGTAACSTGSARKCLTLTLPKPNTTDTEWQHYRYKVYDTVVPLRNVVWSAV